MCRSILLTENSKSYAKVVTFFILFCNILIVSLIELIWFSINSIFWFWFKFFDWFSIDPINFF